MSSHDVTKQVPGSKIESQVAAWFPISRFATIVAVAMTTLAVVGTGVTLADSRWARAYWLFLVPVYGLLCIATAWHRRHATGRVVERTVLHWLGIAVAIAIDFAYVQGTGEQTATGTGLSSLIILSVGCLLAGVHLEWPIGLVGILLLGIVIVVAVAQEYLLLVFLSGTFLLLAYFGATKLLRKAKGQHTPPSPLAK